MAEQESGRTRTVEKIVFSSDELPAELDDRARFSLWRDIQSEWGAFEFYRQDDRRFSARSVSMRFGIISLARHETTVARVSGVAAGGTDNFYLNFNRGRSALLISQDRRQVVLHPGVAAMMTCAEPGDVSCKDVKETIGVVIPRRPLIELVPGAEDMVAVALDRDKPAMRHLWRYLEMLSGPEPVGDDPLLIEHIGTTLLDLIGLTLGASRDSAEVARGRGLRAARLLDIIAEIRARFADPAFSPRDVASKLRLTPRYVQELLSTTGASFTERVLELRLQKARAMLASPRHDRLRVSDIAYSCGFNDISYFNRCFRRRFGASPLQVRAGGGKGP